MEWQNRVVVVVVDHSFCLYTKIYAATSIRIVIIPTVKSNAAGKHIYKYKMIVKRYHLRFCERRPLYGCECVSYHFVRRVSSIEYIFLHTKCFALPTIYFSIFYLLQFVTRWHDGNFDDFNGQVIVHGQQFKMHFVITYLFHVLFLTFFLCSMLLSHWMFVWSSRDFVVVLKRI